jgi:hypothetical protein
MCKLSIFLKIILCFLLLILNSLTHASEGADSDDDDTKKDEHSPLKIPPGNYFIK